MIFFYPGIPHKFAKIKTLLLNDIALLEKIKKEDNTAFNILYNRYWNVLYSYLVARIPDRELVKEVLQDLWIKVWDQPEFVKTNAEGMAGGFLLKFLYFRVLDVYRRTSKINTDHISEDQIVAYNKVFERFNEKELIAIIKKALDKLPKATARIAELRLLQNYSVDETATALSISKKTVRNKYSEALKVIRNNMPSDKSTLSLFLLLYVLLKKS